MCPINVNWKITCAKMVPSCILFLHGTGNHASIEPMIAHPTTCGDGLLMECRPELDVEEKLQVHCGQCGAMHCLFHILVAYKPSTLS